MRGIRPELAWLRSRTKQVMTARLVRRHVLFRRFNTAYSMMGIDIHDLLVFFNLEELNIDKLMCGWLAEHGAVTVTVMTCCNDSDTQC
jgi:hypothetical protein